MEQLGAALPKSRPTGPSPAHPGDSSRVAGPTTIHLLFRSGAPVLGRLDERICRRIACLARVRVRLRDQRAAEATVLRASDAALDLRTRIATVRGMGFRLEDAASAEG